MSWEVSYYGRLDDFTIPAKKVHEHMLDEYIKETLNNEIAKFKKELTEITKILKIDVKEEVSVLKRKVKLLEKKLEKMPQTKLKKQQSEKTDCEKEIIKKNLKAKGFKVD
jgi:hypothetical protein